MLRPPRETPGPAQKGNTSMLTPYSPPVAPHHSLRRSMSLVMLLLFVASLLPGLARQPTASPPDLAAPITPATSPPALTTASTTLAPGVAQAPTYPLPAALTGKPELIGQRTATSATFNMGNGQYALLQSSAALHYQDSQGQWQPIDPAFITLEAGWLNPTNSVQTSLARRTSNAKIGTAQVGIGWQPQSLTLVAGDDTPHVLATPLADSAALPGIRSPDGATIRYPHSWDSDTIQDQWQSRPGSSEYTLRLAALPGAEAPGYGGRLNVMGKSLDLRVHLHLRPGTRIAVDGQPAALPLETTAPLSFVSAAGESLLLQPPTTYEQHNPAAQVRGSYALLPTTDPSVVELRVRTPWTWLAASERQFPVIIDPIFQVRSPTEVLNTIHNKGSGEFVSYIERAPDAQLELGPDGADARRILVRFNLPSLPAGSTIVRALMDVLPSRATPGNDYDTMAVLAQAYPLLNNVWDVFPPRPAPTYDPGNPIPDTVDGDGRVALLWTSSGAVSTVWNITSQVQSWYATGINNGVIIRSENENCNQGPLVLNCGRFYVNAPSTWTDDNLNTDEIIYRLTDTLLPVSSTGTGGIRLFVVYDGPIIAEGQTVDRTGPVFFGPPNNPSTDPPYFRANHDYRLNPLPGTWQALVLRSPGALLGPNPPTNENPAPLIQRWADTLPLRVFNTDGASKQSEILSQDDQVSYILLDGRGNPGAQLRAGVGATSNPQPNGYQLSLMGESGLPLASTLDAPGTVLEYRFDTDTRLDLRNVVMPAGSNSRVDIEFYGINLLQGSDFTGQPFEPRYQVFYDAYVKDIDFRAFLYKSDSRVAKNTTTPGIERYKLARATLPDADFSRLSSPGITPAAGDNYALALEYHGPRTDLYTCLRASGGEFPSCQESGIQRIKLSVRVRVTSCSPGSFPTARGTCQQVVCPSLASQSRDAAGMGLWSESGWNNPDPNAIAATVNEGAAPMIGGVSRAVPTVAVIDGSVSYNRNDNTVVLAPTSEVKLVNCGSLEAPNNPLTNEDTLDVFIGAMYRGVVGSDSVLLPINTNNTRESFLYQVWSTNDLKDLTPNTATLFINPTPGTANGAAQLQRRVPNDQGVITPLFFNPVWSLNVTGWNSLTGSVTPADGNPAPPTIASLLLNLGATLQLDIQPACPSGKCPRQITALRAAQAIISQPPSLGGDDEPVQAVILQRGVPVPFNQPKPCPETSCIDLRGPNDRANLDPPDRNWKMPNVHTNAQAGTVLLQRQGELLAYSTDHPYAGLQAVDQQFSFDAFDARVSIQTEACEPGGAPVTVIRGGTNLALPNIGAGAASIKATFKLCETSLRSVSMSFQSSVGIPIGNSGLFLTGLSGSVDIYADYTQVRFGLDFQAAQGGDGGLFKGHGEVIIDTRGLFAFQGTAKILSTVDADGKLWAAWNPLDIGFEMNVRVGDWLRGFARAHLWQGQGWQNRYTWLPDNNETHIAAQIGATLIIKQGAIFSWWFIDIPPDDIDIGVEVAFGQFCTNSSCTSYEWGVKGKLTILGYDIGLYYGFDEGFDFILGNDDHVLIDQFGGAQTSPILQASFVTGDASPSIRPAAPTINGTSTETFTVTADAENILFALGWQAGAPDLTLIPPDGQAVTAANAVAAGATFSTTTNSILVGVQEPTPGVWQVRINNLSDDGREHYKFVYLANKGAPGTPTNRGRFLTPAAPQEPATGIYTITWEVPADAPDSSTISLYSRSTVPISLEVAPGQEPATRVQNLPIVQNLPFRTGQYGWNTSFLASGVYGVYAVVDDGINDFPEGQISNPDDTCTAVRTTGINPRATARNFDANRFPGTSIFTATGSVRINDTQPPATPTGLAVLGGDDTILAHWDASAAPDIAAYLVEWGYSRPALPGVDSFARLGAQRITAVVTPTLAIRALPGITRPAYQVRVAAIDASGNTSEPSATQSVVTATLTNALPRTPQALTITAASATSASLSWTPDPDGATPASYRLTYIRFGGPSEVGYIDTPATNATISNLPTGAVYRVTVQAAIGEHWFSPATEPVTVTVSSGLDRDSDGLPDDWAQAYGVTNDLSDADRDGLINGRELEAHSNPNEQDTDRDGFSDAEEYNARTSAIDGTSYPTAFTQPRLALATDRLVFRPLLEDPTSYPPQSIAWSNTGGGNLQLIASSTEPWIDVSPVTHTIQVSIDPTGLNPGYYAGVVRLARARISDVPIGPPACIRVEAWVSSEIIGVQSVDISGAVRGSLSTTYTFTASTSPLLASQPVTYTWEATGQAPVTRTGSLTDTISYRWETEGVKTIQVRASNQGYTTVATHVITVGDVRLYLPLLRR